MSEKQKARLEMWWVAGAGKERRILMGNVYGHPHFEDGTFVRTSLIVKMNGDGTAETMNTQYTLGEPAQV